MIRSYFVAIAFVAGLLMVSPASAQFGQGNSNNDLFSQYATSNGTSTAGMYPAPHPSPYLGAHSYYTYQPLMPHEMMYTHSRNYFNYYNTGGYYGAHNALNKTKVRWQSGPNHIGNLPMSSFGAGLNWKLHNRLYCIDGKCGPAVGGCASGDCGSGGAVRGHFHGRGRVRGGGCASGNCQ